MNLEDIQISFNRYKEIERVKQKKLQQREKQQLQQLKQDNSQLKQDNSQLKQDNLRLKQDNQDLILQKKELFKSYNDRLFKQEQYYESNILKMVKSSFQEYEKQFNLKINKYDDKINKLYKLTRLVASQNMILNKAKSTLVDKGKEALVDIYGLNSTNVVETQASVISKLKIFTEQ